MEIIGIVLLVVFVIVCLLIVGLVLIQDEDGDSLGGLFAGGSNSAFGSRSASVLTKTTYVVVGLFFVTAFFLAFMNRTPGDSGLQNAARIEQSSSSDGEWWNTDKSASQSEPAADTAPTDAVPSDAAQPEPTAAE